MKCCGYNPTPCPSVHPNGAPYSIVLKWLSTGDLRFLPDLLTFYGRKVGKFTAVNRPIYGRLFTGSQYKKRRKFWCITIKIRKTQ